MARDLVKLLLVSGKSLTLTATQNLLHVMCSTSKEFQSGMLKQYNKIIGMTGTGENGLNKLRSRLEEHTGFESNTSKLQFNLNSTNTEAQSMLVQMVNSKPDGVCSTNHVTTTKPKQSKFGEYDIAEEVTVEMNELMQNVEKIKNTKIENNKIYSSCSVKDYPWIKAAQRKFSNLLISLQKAQENETTLASEKNAAYNCVYPSLSSNNVKISMLQLPLTITYPPSKPRKLIYQTNYHFDKSEHHVNKTTKKRQTHNKELKLKNYSIALPVITGTGNSLINAVYKNACCALLSKLMLTVQQSNHYGHRASANQVINRNPTEMENIYHSSTKKDCVINNKSINSLKSSKTCGHLKIISPETKNFSRQFVQTDKLFENNRMGLKQAGTEKKVNTDLADVKPLTSGLKSNEELFKNMEEPTQNFKIIETPTENPEVALQDSDNIKEKRTLLENNETVFENTKKIHIFESPTEKSENVRQDGSIDIDKYINDINDRTSILEINEKVFENMEKRIKDINVLEEPTKNPEMACKDKNINAVNYTEDIKDRTNILEINEKVFENTEKVIKKIKIIKKPKNSSGTPQNKKPSTGYVPSPNSKHLWSSNSSDLQKTTHFVPRKSPENVEILKNDNKFKYSTNLVDKLQKTPAYSNNNECPLPITNVDIETAIKIKKETTRSKKTTPKVEGLNRFYQQIEVIKKRSFTLLSNQLIEHARETKKNKKQPQTLSETLFKNTQMSGEAATRKNKENKFANKEILPPLGKPQDFRLENRTSSSATESIKTGVNSKNSSENSKFINRNLEQDNHPTINNIHNNLPIYFKKSPSSLILPKITFWNAQPKLQVHVYGCKGCDKQSRVKQQFSTKYRYETKEVKSVTGDKIQITRLISDNGGH